MVLLKYFKDPKDENELKEIHLQISKISNPEEAYEFAKSIQGWIVNELDEFGDEHFQLTQNWTKISDMFKQKRKKILLVNKVILDNNPSYTTIRAISEILTRCGWCVRGVDDFKGCEMCNRAIQTHGRKLVCEGCDLDNMV
jgi:hypothetical protein